MSQWFRISFCLKIYFVLVLVAGYTVLQSISVCSILVEGHYLGHRFRELFEYILAICYHLSNLVEVYH